MGAEGGARSSISERCITTCLMGGVLGKKIPADLQNAQVQVALQQVKVNAGGLLVGYVDLTILGPIQCEAVNVDCKCEANTTVHYTTRSGGKHKRTHHHTARELDTVYLFRMAGASYPLGQASPGRFQIPFQFQIPPNAPSSTSYRRDTRNSGSITHMIAVNVVAKGVSYNVYGVPFQVVGQVLHQVTAQMIEDTKFVNFCCCFSRGDMTLGAMSNKNAYTAGEAASVTYEVNNNSTSGVNDIVVSLKSKILFSARNHRFSCINCHGPPVKVGKVLTKTGVGSKAIVTPSIASLVHLQVPMNIPYTTMNTRTMNIAYFLELYCETGSCITNPCVKLPVTIYQSSTMDQHMMAQAYAFCAEDDSPDREELPAMPMATTVAYQPQGGAITPTGYSMKPVPVDTTGDGIANAVGYDTTGDGKIDSLDTNGDGIIDTKVKV